MLFHSNSPFPSACVLRRGMATEKNSKSQTGGTGEASADPVAIMKKLIEQQKSLRKLIDEGMREKE